MRVLAVWVTSASNTHPSARFVIAAAVRRLGFCARDLQVLIMDPLVAIQEVLGSLATMRTAGCDSTHAISVGEATYRA